MVDSQARPSYSNRAPSPLFPTSILPAKDGKQDTWGKLLMDLGTHCTVLVHLLEGDLSHVPQFSQPLCCLTNPNKQFLSRVSEYKDNGDPASPSVFPPILQRGHRSPQTLPSMPPFLLLLARPTC